jgi:SAM-dependent methyltransferase
MNSLKSLLATIDDERRLIEGSHVYGEGATFESWRLQRRFIADAIHRPGIFLDIGCANGLLLRCLQAWSKYQIVPYGIDADKNCLAPCSRLFPESPHQFAHLSISDLARLPEVGLPASYDFVYWNVWDDFDFSQAWQQEVVEPVFQTVAASGRLILGFYDKESAAINAKLAWLIENIAPASGLKTNSPRGEVIAWWDKS